MWMQVDGILRSCLQLAVSWLRWRDGKGGERDALAIGKSCVREGANESARAPAWHIAVIISLTQNDIDFKLICYALLLLIVACCAMCQTIDVCWEWKQKPHKNSCVTFNFNLTTIFVFFYLLNLNEKRDNTSDCSNCKYQSTKLILNGLLFELNELEHWSIVWLNLNTVFKINVYASADDNFRMSGHKLYWNCAPPRILALIFTVQWTVLPLKMKISHFIEGRKKTDRERESAKEKKTK